MGGRFSSPDSLDTLQSYGSVALLTTLSQEQHFDEFEKAEDESIDSVIPLLRLFPQDVYEDTEIICSKICTSALELLKLLPWYSGIGDFQF